jgi:transposase-like protein
MERRLLEERLDAGESYEQIGRSVGRHPSTVSHWARRHGLTSAHAPAHAARGGIASDVLTELVNRGLSVRQIAAELDRSATTVRHWLRAYGLHTRRRHLKAVGSGAESVVGTCPRHGESTFVPRRDSRGWRCFRCRVEAVTRSRQRVKEILVAEAGGRCALCGYDRCIGALSFHHLDPAEKRFNINRLGTSLGRARAEARKCVLLCTNCHAEVESGVTRLSCAPQL